MPKGRASKLVPKYVGPYKITKAIPLTSNYELELPMELVKRRIHQQIPCEPTKATQLKLMMHYSPAEGKRNCMISAHQMNQNGMSTKSSAIIGKEGILNS